MKILYFITFLCLGFLSCKPNNNLNDTSWYTEDQINTLLKHYLPQGGYFVAAQSQLEHRSLIGVNVMAAINVVIYDGKIAVLPIQVHGNHWVGVMIRKRSLLENVLQVIYNNPQGSPLAGEAPHDLNLIDPILNNLPPGWDHDLRDLQLVQQKNSYDCGPFTVDNLVKLAEADTLSNLSNQEIIDGVHFQHPENGSAYDIRQEHKKILNNS